MKDLTAEIQRLSDTLIYEIINAAGLPKTRGLYRLFRPLFHKPTQRMASIGVELDQRIAEQDVAQATGWALTNWCSRVGAEGRAAVPQSGPLLLVANHAGAYDTFVICSQLGRPDFKVISSDIQFFKYLPNVAEHAIFLTGRTQDRMAAARAGIRHLQNGGALLVYGTGLIDPDPAVYPNAEKHIERWSSSVDLFLRTVPATRLLVTIVSGVVSQRWARHPVTWLRSIDWQKRRIAEFGQVITQLFAPGKMMLTPNVSFAPPVDVETLRREAAGRELLPAVIARGKSLLAEHCRRFECLPLGSQA
jgi:hypothetical protein